MHRYTLHAAFSWEKVFRNHSTYSHSHSHSHSVFSVCEWSAKNANEFMQKMFISWKRADLNFIEQPSQLQIWLSSSKREKILFSFTWNDVENSNYFTDFAFLGNMAKNVHTRKNEKKKIMKWKWKRKSFSAIIIPFVFFAFCTRLDFIEIVLIIFGFWFSMA